MSFLKRQKTKDGLTLLLSFLLPVGILLLTFAAAGVYPRGDRTILHVDMYHQYAPFFMELLNKLQSGGSPFFSWDIGIGSDFVSTYAYYLASPLNFLLLFVPRRFLLEFMTALILLKAGFCGLSTALFLRGHFRVRTPLVLFPAVLYALSGFFSAYYWDIMWLDCVALFPLILLGLERLVREKKSALYAITLALSIWSNYYISIMVCIFLALWYFLMLPEMSFGIRERVKSFGRLARTSVLSAGISAVLLLPEIAALKVSGSGTNTFPTDLSFYFSPLEGISQHLTLMPVTTTEGELPNLFCGAAALFFLVLYVLNRRIPTVKKLRRLVLLCVLFLSFELNILDFFWHGFHFPEGLPARESFLYVFLLLTLGFEALIKQGGNRPRDYLVALLLNAALFVCIYFFTDAEERVLALGVTVLFLLAAAGLCFTAHYGPAYLRRLLFVLGLILVSTEAGLNFTDTGLSTTSRSAYLERLTAYHDLTAQVQRDDPSFFRIEKYERMMKDENCLSGYPAATLFSSLVNYDVAMAYKAIGMEGGRNFYCYNGATPLPSALLSVKYFLTDSAYDASPYRSLVAEEDGVYLYENKYSLPLGVFTERELLSDFDPEECADRVTAVNQLGFLLGAKTDLMQYAGEVQTEGGNSTFVAGADGWYFAEHRNRGVSSMTVETAGKETTLSKTTHNYFLDLGYLRAGQEAKIRAANGDDIEADCYRIDTDAVEAVLSLLDRNTMELLFQSDTEIRGRVDAETESDLLLSIAAEDGWRVFVDGEEIAPGRWFHAFLRVPVPAGTHEITLRYRTPYFALGLMISVACAGALILVLLREQRKRRRFAMKRDLGVLQAVYPMPVLLIATYDEDGTVDVMNAAWGNISETDKIALFISEPHKTTKNIRALKAFTVSLADETHIAEADYFGIASGNNTPDKFARTGLTVTKSAHVNAPIVNEFPLVMECELCDIVDTEHLHAVIGKIVNVAADESVLDDDGKVDPAKLHAVAFDNFRHGYYKLGEQIAQAWDAGKKWK